MAAEQQRRANGDDDIFVRVTNREIWLQLQAVAEEIRGVRGDQKTIIEEQAELRKRIRSLELRFYGILAGVISAITLLLGIIASGHSPIP